MKAPDEVPFRMADDVDGFSGAYADDIGIDESLLFAKIGAILNVMETRAMYHVEHGLDKLFAKNKACRKLKACHLK